MRFEVFMVAKIGTVVFWVLIHVVLWVVTNISGEHLNFLGRIFL
jgi:hypothetical protein